MQAATHVSVRALQPRRRRASPGRWLAWQLHKLAPQTPGGYQRVEIDRVVLNEIEWRGDEAVLDVGAGRGYYASQLAHRGCRVTAVDYDHRLLRAACDPRVDRVQADGHRLPLRGGQFDAVMCNFVVALFAEPATAVGELIRVCRPGGRIIMSVSNLDAPYQRFNAWLDRVSPGWPRRKHVWAHNAWHARDWIAAMQGGGAALEAIYSCNLSGPLVPRVRGWQVVPNRLMLAWCTARRRFAGRPLRSDGLDPAAYDYVLCFRKPRDAR